VQQRIERRADVEVAHRQLREVDVGAEERGSDPSQRTRSLRGERARQRSEHGDDGEHDGESRQEAPHAPRVEAGQVDPPVRRQLPQERRGDHEARDREEDVDAAEAPGQGQSRVIRDHEQDCNGAQALDVRAEGHGSIIG
jgi:hypothetical protein